MRVLLTRSRPDAEETARLLAERNIETVIAPVIDISDNDGVTLDLEGVQALLFTSANGVRAFARATARRDLPVFAVGDASAQAAVDNGFSEVASANGDVAALAALVRERLDPGAGALLHAAGSAVAGDLAGDLTDYGFAVRRTVLYRAQTVDILPVDARHALQDGTVDAALFYSPRTAAHFAALVAAAGLQSSCRQIIAGCLSDAVGEAAATLPFADIRVAKTPDQAALFDVLAPKK